jgi:hypothetical protein
MVSKSSPGRRQDGNQRGVWQHASLGRGKQDCARTLREQTYNGVKVDEQLRWSASEWSGRYRGRGGVGAGNVVKEADSLGAAASE